MQKQRPTPQDLDDILGDSDLTALVELQQFLADEIVGTLGPGTTTDLSRAFVPLTDGLGLEAPSGERRNIVPPVSSAFGSSVAAPGLLSELMPEATSPYSTGSAPELSAARDLRRTINWDDEVERERVPRIEPPVPVTNELSRPTLSEVMGERPQADEPLVPPPLPSVSFFRRVFSGMFDIAFVAALWAFAVVATSRLLGDASPDVLSQVATDFSKTGFVRLVVMEYVGLWSLYFFICQGMLDTTLGMWVWGVRVSFGEKTSWGGLVVRKFMRMVASILFFAPIAPTLALAVRIRGRNLLDWISGTSLYRSSL